MSAERRFVENARRLRKAQGRSAAWVARHAGWSKSNQTKFDSGQRRVWLDDAVRVSQILGVDFPVLMGELTDEEVDALATPKVEGVRNVR